MEQLTPMMKQYMETKEQYKDCILFYRLGDFYEMFFEDAISASKELEITLTGKNCGLEERAPMCGIPYHAVEGYLSKLISKGYKVAICEQVEDPKTAKGIVKREVIRIVTPGTNLNTGTLDETKNNYLMSIVHTDNEYGISIVDVTTGDYYLTEVDSNRKLIDEINKFSPTEIICNDSFFVSGVDIEDLKNRLNIAISSLEPWYFDDELCIRSLKNHFKVSSLDGLGLKDYSIGIIAAGSIMQYLMETQKNSLSHITYLTPYITSKYMLLDSSTRRNLELNYTLREKQKRGSLLWVLDKTKTAMGARLLRNYIEQPLIDKEEIEQRLDAIEELNDNLITREEIREYLNPIYDLERLIMKVSYKNANPRDLVAFMSSLAMLPHISYLLEPLESNLLKQIHKNLDPLEDIHDLIEKAIIEEPPIAVKEGGIIKEGYSEEVDKLRKAKTEGKTWLAELEAKERDNTGIKNLKIKYNKVFGYYLEVTNSYQNLVPDTWSRKQTLANAERYTTPELKELEDIILGAEDKLFALEYDLFNELRESIAKEVLRIQTTAKAIAKLDVFSSLAYVAEHNNFVRPTVNEEGIIDIKDGRHPVVEKMISNDLFVSNDTYLNNDKNRVSIITGPNMAGKSTYMRQTALIVLMAQLGSFVPAASANIGIVDRIFTRVGASDDLASGQSTFMVEMTEVANILRNATKDSLLILDEIGRGTSTFDGLSIAWAVVEHISNPRLLGAKTLFATHYHELTELEGKLDSVNNYCIAVKEQGDDIVFLRKIVQGGADKSYGIQVAKLAGVPETVLKRARQIANELNEHDITIQTKCIDVKKDLNETNNKLSENIESSMESINVTLGENASNCESMSSQLDGNYMTSHSYNIMNESITNKDAIHSNHSLVKSKKSELDLNQMSLFSVNQSVDEIVLELRELDISNMTPMDAMNKLYMMQRRIKEQI
ncbi:DNA mismatch repair protein MutS [Anaeromicropila herbilytica]|uniref:DNA mismatch repair protein MutS n=1 Tax=Anaeromicropila herbilytica TaxID=2785025 RepID=A0A7R7IEN6_9FIRM|nr:DNA mismatch repair protein MutS [Anaeromicropila herbilytica]BCN31298.1 DNA mismatch repair protein MutS [Anaeromicropila herbilytica]